MSMLQAGESLQLGRYRIKGQLNQGGMSTVYLATDRNLSERAVAIKENIDSSISAQQQFQHEAALLARLTHPNLPRVTDYFIEPSGQQYLVMDYIAGDDLRQIIRKLRQPLAEADVLTWINQVMDALVYMHDWIDPETGEATPIIHRDIKPGNIKRTLDGRVVLVDFGLAKYQANHQETQVGARAVTPGYSPPEQYVGGTDVRSDVYALGATLYMLLTGEKPPDAPLIANGTPLPTPRQLNAQISRNTERAILRAMQLKPEDRFQSIRAMQRALLGHETTHTIRPGGSTATGKFNQRWGSTLWFAGIAGLLVIVVVLVAERTWFNSQLPPNVSTQTVIPTLGTAAPISTQASAEEGPQTAQANLTAPTGLSPANSLVAYHDDGQTFTIMLPPGWRQNSINERTFFVAPDQVVQVFVQPVPTLEPSDTPQKLLQRFVDNGGLPYENIQAVGDGQNRTIGVYTGHEERFKGSYFGTPITIRLIALTEQGHGYLLGAIIVSNQEPIVNAWLDNALNSFTINK